MRAALGTFRTTRISTRFILARGGLKLKLYEQPVSSAAASREQQRREEKKKIAVRQRRA